MAAPGSPSVHMRSEELIRRAELEHGSFGRVHLCYHKTLGQVVLKTMYTGPQRNGENKRLLLEEGTMMHNLNHERIVKLHGVILESGAYSLVIEVIPKDNLLTVRERTLPISIKGRIILEILEGMFYLTKNNVIHRDLKPENILVDKDFHIKIADLGLASCQTWSRLTMEESRKQSRRGGVVPIVGSSLCYLAPEHLENIHAHSTEKSDVYSFAIIVWVILTGKEPYENARNQDHICQCVCKGNRPDEQLILPDTPSDIVRLMRKCWHPQPEMRPTFAESYKLFQEFYSMELEQYVEKDLFKLMADGTEEMVRKMKSVSLEKPSSQTDCSAPLWRNIGLPVEASTEDMTFYLAGETEGSIEADANVINFKPGLKPQPGQACHNPINSISPPLWNPGRNSAGDDRNIVQRVGSAQAMSPLHSRLSKSPTSVSMAPSPRCVCAEKPTRMQPGAPQGHQPLQRIRSFPGFPLPQYECPVLAPTSQSNCASMMCCQDSGVFIQNAKWIQIGDNNQLNLGSQDLGPSSFQPSVASSSIFQELLCTYGNHVVREEHLHVLRNNIGGKWKQCARRLGLSENDVETIAHDFARDGLQEMVHQMLERWRMKEGLAGTTMASLCRALRDLIKEDVLLQLLQICGNLSSL
ncbi:receptor-interacting serine/threonine-protein kinase 1-like [Scleropages formosus]|uniref:Receptor (TNFRSF)-interacting serine-threonine kinase 1, like n=1 Tax=Scleropages formosus TaxID=113540 RepID=A0A8C9RQ16_SCLFO|nr:receptor-interacting serine/threonine-protein kinase 1 [Scleropages formosus]